MDIIEWRIIMEIWKDVESYKGYYQVSNLGNVRSLTRSFTRSDGKVKTFQGKLLTTKAEPSGYKHVNLSKHGKAHSVRIHRLVAYAFIENPNNYPCINHKDENKQNNTVDNLEWCTYQYNLTYNDKQLKRATKVDRYAKDGAYINTYISLTEAQRDTGADQRNIGACCRGKIKSCGGYVWKYS